MIRLLDRATDKLPRRPKRSRHEFIGPDGRLLLDKLAVSLVDEIPMALAEDGSIAVYRDGVYLTDPRAIVGPIRSRLGDDYRGFLKTAVEEIIVDELQSRGLALRPGSRSRSSTVPTASSTSGRRFPAARPRRPDLLASPGPVRPGGRRSDVRGVALCSSRRASRRPRGDPRSGPRPEPYSAQGRHPLRAVEVREVDVPPTGQGHRRPGEHVGREAPPARRPGQARLGPALPESPQRGGRPLGLARRGPGHLQDAHRGGPDRRRPGSGEPGSRSPTSLSSRSRPTSLPR